ncbi:MAG TPA: P-II family nitrogen regulator [Nitrospirota bacterium]|nr:P-II family nitrogen regulator [Nitrospirota bacterium]
MNSKVKKDNCILYRFGYTAGFILKVKSGYVVSNNMVKPAMDILVKIARSGKVRYGKKVIIKVDQAVLIRAGETNDGAL